MAAARAPGAGPSGLGDEGSACWIAARAANLFYRQADGRLPRSQLYFAFMQEFGLKDPLHFSIEFEKAYAQTPADLASFQHKVLRLCQEGDPQVISLYRSAGEELAQLVQTLLARLDFGDQPAQVTYTGGLFNAGRIPYRTFFRGGAGFGRRHGETLVHPDRGRRRLRGEKPSAAGGRPRPDGNPGRSRLNRR